MRRKHNRRENVMTAVCNRSLSLPPFFILPTRSPFLQFLQFLRSLNLPFLHPSEACPKGGLFWIIFGNRSLSANKHQYNEELIAQNGPLARWRTANRNSSASFWRQNHSKFSRDLPRHHVFLPPSASVPGFFAVTQTWVFYSWPFRKVVGALQLGETKGHEWKKLVVDKEISMSLNMISKNTISLV